MESVMVSLLILDFIFRFLADKQKKVYLFYK